MIDLPNFKSFLVGASPGRPVEQKSPSLTHESSSVGARPSSAAPVEQYPGGLQTEQSQLNPCELSVGRGAEDGRAPTEEHLCVRGCYSVRR
jgi:hypothetical protein